MEIATAKNITTIFSLATGHFNPSATSSSSRRRVRSDLFTRSRCCGEAFIPATSQKSRRKRERTDVAGLMLRNTRLCCLSYCRIRVVSNHRIVVACCFLQNISHIFLKPRIAKLAPEGVDILRDVHYRYRRLEWTWHRFPKDAGAGLFLES